MNRDGIENAISEVLLTTKAESKKIGHAITQAIVDGLKKDGFVTIQDLGRFYLFHWNSYWKPCLIRDDKGGIAGQYNRFYPEHDVVLFRPCKKLKRSLLEVEPEEQCNS